MRDRAETCKVDDCRGPELQTILEDACDWFDVHRPKWGPGTLPTWYVDAKAALQQFQH